MVEKFKQKQLFLDPEKSSGKIKIEKLCALIETHPYKEDIYEVFDVESIKNNYISIDYVDLVYNSNYSAKIIKLLTVFIGFQLPFF